MMSRKPRGTVSPFARLYQSFEASAELHQRLVSWRRHRPPLGMAVKNSDVDPTRLKSSASCSIVAANPGHEAQNYLWGVELIVFASRGDSLLTKTVPRSRGARGGELSRCETVLDAVKGLGFRERVRLGGARLVGRGLGGRILAGHRVCERQRAGRFAQAGGKVPVEQTISGAAPSCLRKPRHLLPGFPGQR